MAFIKPKTIVSFILIMLIGGAVMFGFSGCFGKKYKVDYCGQKGAFQNAKDSYRAGETVELYFTMIATDTDYNFYLDGASYSPDYDSKGGGMYIIRFTMPDHDVKLSYTSRNSMEINIESQNEMLVDYYYAIVGTDGGDSKYELVLSKTQSASARLDVYKTEPDSTEKSTTYMIPYEAVTQCYEVIDSAKMREWNKKGYDSPVDGAVTVVKFRDDDGSYISVSTNKAPSDGERNMDKIKIILEGYATDENRI